MHNGAIVFGELKMEIVKIESSVIGGNLINTVNARELHDWLEVGKDFSNWIKGRIDQYGFVEDQDYVLAKTGEQLPSGLKHRIDYHISIDMAKELSMVERNEKGKQARQYFIECERKVKDSMPRNLPDALRAYANELEQKELLQLQLQQSEIRTTALEITLDRAELHASVKKMEARYGRSFSWQLLKEYSLANGYDMPKVFDQNYERGVNSYHDDVWTAVYKVTTQTRNSSKSS
jgi:phage anti-repressor protein